MLTLGMVLLFSNQSVAQKFSKPKRVTYLQLPTNPDYASAIIYVMEEPDQVNAKVGSSLGKFASKFTSKVGKKIEHNTGQNVTNDKINASIEKYVQDIFKSKEKPAGQWDFFPRTYDRSKQHSAVKVVIAYLPDEMAKPMGKPMKNNKGLYTFPYRVKVQMRVFDPNNQLLMSKNFGAVSGIGHSKTWPENAKGMGGMFKVSTDKKGGHHEDPYKKACIRGAIKQCRRVVYGIYGVRIFEVPLNVAAFKKDKASEKYKKMYEEVMKSNTSGVLNAQQQQVIQQCVDYWKSIEGKVKSSEAWAVHYNLALGYSWLLDVNQARQQIKQVYDLNKGIFSKIANKSGSFNGKDIKVLEHYNYAQPFAEYYAAGIKDNPKYASVPGAASKKPRLFDEAVYFIRNWNISRSLGIPLPLPLFAKSLLGKSIKNLDGIIYKNGQEQMDFKFEFKKGHFVNAEFHKGEKKQLMRSKLLASEQAKKGVVELGVPKIDNEVTAPNSFDEDCYGSFADGNVLEKGNEITLHLTDFTFPQVFMPFIMKNKSFSGKTGCYCDFHVSLIGDGSDGNYSQFDFYGPGRSGFDFFDLSPEIKSKYSTPKVTVNINCTQEKGESSEIGESFKVLDKNKEGYPTKVQVTYYGKGLYFNIHANIKQKFGETTYHEMDRQDKANREVRPKVSQMLVNTVKENGGTISKTTNSKKETFYDVKLVKTYTIAYKFDSRGNWTQIKTGDFTVTRNIEYK